MRLKPSLRALSIVFYTLLIGGIILWTEGTGHCTVQGTIQGAAQDAQRLYDPGILDRQALEIWEDYAFSQSGPVQTEALLVSWKGKIIYERYDHGYTDTMKHLSWSAAKGLASLLVGAAIEDGKLSEEDPLSRFFPDLPAEKGKITVQNLLQMTSGIASNENVEHGPTASDSVAMLFREGAQDIAGYTLSLPQKFPPGVNFSYSSGDTNILMAVLKKVMSPDEYREYPFRRILDPLGIRSATFEQDGSGTFIGSTFFYATARDYLKLGQFYLNEGTWQNKALLSQAYFQRVKHLSPGFLSPHRSHLRSPFGAHLWLNREVTDLGGEPKRPYRSAPASLNLILGHEGQGIYLLPEQDLVVVRLAQDRGKKFNRDYFLNLFFRSFLKPETDLKLNQADLPTYLTAPEAREDEGIQGATEREFYPLSRSWLKLPEIAAGYAARQYCSCRFVVGQSKTYCRALTRQGVPLFSVTESIVARPEKTRGPQSAALRTVTVRSFFSKRQAVFLSDRLGCRLVF